MTQRPYGCDSSKPNQIKKRIYMAKGPTLLFLQTKPTTTYRNSMLVLYANAYSSI